MANIIIIDQIYKRCNTKEMQIYCTCCFGEEAVAEPVCPCFDGPVAPS